MNYIEALKTATEYETHIDTKDKRFNYNVQIIHSDGSMVFYNGGFVMTKDKWYFVFTEHHGYKVLHDDDVIRCLQFQYIPSEKIK